MTFQITDNHLWSEIHLYYAGEWWEEQSKRKPAQVPPVQAYVQSAEHISCLRF